MGCSRTFACHTCKKAYDLGYGSYSSWLYEAKTLDEYDALPDKEGYKDRQKNKNIRQCLVEHQGHDFTHFCDDDTWMDEKTGDLLMQGGYSPCIVYVEKFKEYEQIGMDDGWDPVNKVQH